ncbi:hypothetical protein [Scytonema sp. PRP1]|uniref:hypothetical protein n=1 Tax=Scytonema sp. PRP1 TaxID=3120513 RepID=UPI002FCFE5AD
MTTLFLVKITYFLPWHSSLCLTTLKAANPENNFDAWVSLMRQPMTYDRSEEISIFFQIAALFIIPTRCGKVSCFCFDNSAKGC